MLKLKIALFVLASVVLLGYAEGRLPSTIWITKKNMIFSLTNGVKVCQTAHPHIYFKVSIFFLTKT